MFCIAKDTELTTALLSKMISRFGMVDRPRLIKYKDYYDGAQEILKKSYSDPTKPCSKVVSNYCKTIVDAYNGYLAAPNCISYRSEQDIETIMDILRYNDYQSEDSAFLHDALVFGKAAELMFIDSQAKTRFRTIDPISCFGVYDNSLTNDLLYFVRIYDESEWDNTDTYLVDVYGDYSVKTYRMAGWNGALEFVAEMPHYFSQCPANIFYLPDEKSIFDCVMGLQDAYNEVFNNEVDDYAAFVDAYLALTGMDADSDDIARMKENRVMLFPDGGSGTYLTKNFNDAQVENILKRIHTSIYTKASCPDFSSESFVGGVSSGIAIQYRLTGMETRVAPIEAEMKKALQRRIEIICGIASLKFGEEIFRDVDIQFKRNIPVDTAAVVDMIGKLKGTVSDATLIGQLDFVTDVNAEIEAIQEQKERNISLYSFGTTATEETEETEE